MRKEIFIWSFTFLLFGFLCYLMYKNLNKNISDITKEVNLLSQKNELLKNSWFETLLYNNFRINEELLLMSDTGSISLQDAITEKTLVVKLSYSACKSCLERELKNIHELEKKEIPIIIIASYPNKHSLDILLKQYKICSKAYLLYPNHKTFPFDENTSLLYMFITDHELAVKYFFIPIQMIDDVSDIYFKHIENIFQPKSKKSNFLLK